MSPADYDRIHNPDLREHFVYRLYGKRGRLLYIGCSMNLKVRLGEHGRHGVYGHLIERITTEGPYSYAEGRQVERTAIETERPAYNREWTPRFHRGRYGWDQPRPHEVKALGWSA